MSGYTVGDVLWHDQLDALPDGAVLVLAVGVYDGEGKSLLVRVAGTWFWWSPEIRAHARPHPKIYVGQWRLIYLPTPKPVTVPKLGDVVDTEEQARLLPVGAVVVNESCASDISIKIGDDRWMFHSLSSDAPGEHRDHALDDDEHRVVHIPDADADTSRTAA